jgi:hypothetical protein
MNSTLANSTLANSLGPLLLRGASAAAALLTLKLTYNILSPHDFASFSLVLFAFAICSSLSSPINRLFWAENSPALFVQSMRATPLLVALGFMPLLIFSGLQAADTMTSMWALYFCAAAYGLTRMAEPFIYGQLVFDRGIGPALFFSFLFVGCELIFILALYILGIDSLIWRLMGTIMAMAAAILAVPRHRHYGTRIFAKAMVEGAAHKNVFGEMLSARGAKMLSFSVLTTLAVMMDRLILRHFPLQGADYTADYLLVLSYTIAVQTFLCILIDMGRKHIYQNGQWVVGGRQFAGRALLSAPAAVIGMLCIFPILRLLEIIPASIGIYIWAALLIRSACLFTVNFTFIDCLQSGQITKAIWPTILMAALGFGFLGMLLGGVAEGAASIIFSIAAIIIAAISALRFYQRMPIALV